MTIAYPISLTNASVCKPARLYRSWFTFIIRALLQFQILVGNLIPPTNTLDNLAHALPCREINLRQHPWFQFQGTLGYNLGIRSFCQYKISS